MQQQVLAPKQTTALTEQETLTLGLLTPNASNCKNRAEPPRPPRNDTMATPRRPPFARSRRSYFREEPMEEYTPANSTHELSLREGARGWGHVRFWTDGEGRLGLRLVNAVLHLGLCCVLLAIMAEFMVRYRGGRRRCVRSSSSGCFGRRFSGSILLLTFGSCSTGTGRRLLPWSPSSR